MVTIRRFREADGPAVRALHERALRATGTDPADVPGTEDLADIRGSYLDAGGEFLVAERDGEIVGMGGLKVDGAVDSPQSDPTGELFRMRVDPDHQREGIGTRLLDRLEAAARERGVERLLVETAVRQTAAASFYPSRGYTERRRRTYGEYDLVQFSKDLTR